MTEEERQALEARRDMFTSANMASIFWTVVLDSKTRRYLRALDSSNRNRCLVQFIFSDLKQIADEQQFKGRLIAGDFAFFELS